MSRGMYLTMFFFLAFAVTRIAGATNVFFKDAAHLYVGGLFGAAIVLWSIPVLIRHRIITTLQVRQGWTESQACAFIAIVEENLHLRAKSYLCLAVFLTITETLVAITTRIFA